MLFQINANDVANTRKLVCDAVDARKAWEQTVPQRNVNSKIDYLNTFRKRVERADAFALGYLHTHPVAFDAVFMSHKRSNQAFNIYAMPKVLEVARCLNGGALNPAMGGDHMTIAGTILAIASGITLESQIAHYINTFAHEMGRAGYSSGGTQSSSSLRALEALGVVKQVGKLANCAMWGAANADAFQRMVDASSGKSVPTVTAEMEAAAHEESGESDTKAGRAKSRSKGGSKAGKRKSKGDTAPAGNAAVEASTGQEEASDDVMLPADYDDSFVPPVDAF